MRHISFDRVKIKGDHSFVKGVKLEGSKVQFSNLGGQNRKFVKFEKLKVHFNLNIIHRINFPAYNNLEGLHNI